MPHAARTSDRSAASNAPSGVTAQGGHGRSYSTGVFDMHPSYATSPPRQHSSPSRQHARGSPRLNGRILEQEGEASEEASGDSAELLTDSALGRSAQPRWPGMRSYSLGLWGKVRQARPSEVG